MFRYVFFCSVLSSAAALGGCAAIVPKYDIPVDMQGAPSTKQIIDKVTCELAGLVTKPNDYDILLVQDVVVVVQLNLTVNDTGGLAPSFTYMSGPFTFNAGAAISQSREQNFTELLVYSLKELKKTIDIEKQVSGRDVTKCDTGPTNLEGNLGIRQAVALAVNSPHLNWESKATGATGGVFGGYVSFVVTKNLNAVGPTWALKHFTGPGKLASVSEVNTDKIVFAFAQTEPSDKNNSVVNALTKAKSAIDSINLNQLSTQLSGIRQGLQ